MLQGHDEIVQQKRDSEHGYQKQRHPVSSSTVKRIRATSSQLKKGSRPREVACRPVQAHQQLRACA